MKTHPLSNHRGASPQGFTLLEILAATVVATILLTLGLQILGGSSATVRTADYQRNAQTQLRTALDRFAADFSTAMLTGGMTAIWKESTTAGNGSEISFLCRSRPEKGSATPRAAAISYRLDELQDRGKTCNVLMRGDGGIDFTTDLIKEFNQLAGPTDSTLWNGWEPLGTGIVRFHISFLLDDGSIRQTPPAYSMISPQTASRVSFFNGLSLPSGSVAIAFHERNRQFAGIGNGDPANNDRYVKALIVAAAALDPDMLRQVTAAGKLDEINRLGIPDEKPAGNDNPDLKATPLEAWEKNLTQIEYKPLLQNIRFQQRIIPIP